MRQLYDHNTANYQYIIFILSVGGNRGINFGTICFHSLLSLSRLCWLTNLLSCFDHKCDYHHTRDIKTPYLRCAKEHALKPELQPWGIWKRRGEREETHSLKSFMLSAYSPLLVKHSPLSQIQHNKLMDLLLNVSNRYRRATLTTHPLTPLAQSLPKSSSVSVPAARAKIVQLRVSQEAKPSSERLLAELKWSDLSKCRVKKILLTEVSL